MRSSRIWWWIHIWSDDEDDNLVKRTKSGFVIKRDYSHNLCNNESNLWFAIFGISRLERRSDQRIFNCQAFTFSIRQVKMFIKCLFLDVSHGISFIQMRLNTQNVDINSTKAPKAWMAGEHETGKKKIELT